MARPQAVTITNYRSIEGPLTISFPERCPIVLIGENNVGKSNIVRAIDLVLGSFWPGSQEPEDNDFFDRDPTRNIEIRIDFPEDDRLGRFSVIRWRYDAGAREVAFTGYARPDLFGGNYVRNEDRDHCMSVTLQAERDLRYQLSYNSKYTLLSKLMHSFHRAMLNHPGTKEELQRLFAEVKGHFQAVPEFADFTNALRTHLGEFVGTMSHRLQVDFEAYNPINFFHALRLQADENGSVRALEEMGTGEQQILALSFAYAYATAFHGGILLVIEEPEAHLHPLAQQWLASRLFNMCRDGLPVLITTHSPHFINLLQLEGLVVLRKGPQGTVAVQLSAGELADHCIALGARADRATEDRILQFYADNATPDILEGFFAKAVVLVEGPSESLALPHYLGRVGLQTNREGIAVIPVGGKGNLAKWRRLFTAFEIPVYIVFDNDPEDDNAGTKRRDALTSVGVTIDEDQTRYIEATDWLVEDFFCVFGEDFERTFRRLAPDYERLEDAARENGIYGKPLVARWVAERLVLAPGSEILQKLDQFRTRLEALVRPEVPADNQAGDEVEAGQEPAE